MNKISHIEWVDCAKGLAILLIIHLHVLNGVASLYTGLELTSDYVDFVTRFIRRFHMPLFYFLSGLFVARSLTSRSTREYLLDKVYIILWPYLLWSFIQGLTQVYFSGLTNNPWTLQHLLHAIVFDPIQQFWFLYVLFIYYVAYLLLQKNIAIALIISLALFVASYYIHDTYYIRITRHLLFFMLGSVMLKHLHYLTDSRYKNYILLPIFIILCVDVYFNISNNFASRLFIMVAAIIMVIGLSDLLVKRNFRKFNYIGSIVLQIYLVHMLATAGTRIVLHNFLHISDITVHIVAGTLAGLLFPLIMVWVVDRYKIPYLFSLKRN